MSVGAAQFHGSTEVAPESNAHAWCHEAAPNPRRVRASMTAEAVERDVARRIIEGPQGAELVEVGTYHGPPRDVEAWAARPRVPVEGHTISAGSSMAAVARLRSAEACPQRK